MIDVAVFSDYEIERNKPMPSLNHGLIQANIIFALKFHYGKRFSVASELSLDLADWSSVPDVCLYPKRPLDFRNDVIAMTEPPLCAIEIVSPSQSINELTDKADRYFEHGARSCWIVIPRLGNIYVFSSPGEYQIFRSTDTLHDTMLDISIPLKEVFE